MNNTNEWLEIHRPKTMLGRCCEICEETFVINHIDDRRTICPKCKETLKQLILDRRKK